jgi:hypothetical protein
VDVNVVLGAAPKQAPAIFAKAGTILARFVSIAGIGWTFHTPI